MPTVDESVNISRSTEDVWAFLSDPDNLMVYESQIAELEQITEGAVGVGTRFRGVTRVLGRKLKWVSEVTTFDAPSAYATKTVEANLAFSVSWTLKAEGDGTRMDYRIEAESGLGGVFGKLGEPMVVKAQQRTVRTNLANLKGILESGDA